jgi:hypothetical protein
MHGIILHKAEKRNHKAEALERAKQDRHEPARSRLIKKSPESAGHLGLSKKGVYRHNPESGFNELVHKRTGKFTGKSPY